MKKNKWILPLLAIVLGAIFYILLTQVLHSCPIVEGEKPMKCNWTKEALIGLSYLIIVLGVFKLIPAFSKFVGGIAIAEMGIGVYGILLTKVFIGTCKTETMVCNLELGPGSLLVLGVYILLSLVTFVSNRKME